MMHFKWHSGLFWQNSDLAQNGLCIAGAQIEPFQSYFEMGPVVFYDFFSKITRQ